MNSDWVKRSNQIVQGMIATGVFLLVWFLPKPTLPIHVEPISMSVLVFILLLVLGLMMWAAKSWRDWLVLTWTCTYSWKKSLTQKIPSNVAYAMPPYDLRRGILHPILRC